MATGGDDRRGTGGGWPGEHDAVTREVPMPDAKTRRVERPILDEESTAIVALPEGAPKRGPIDMSLLPAAEEESARSRTGPMVALGVVALLVVGLLVLATVDFGGDPVVETPSTSGPAATPPGRGLAAPASVVVPASTATPTTPAATAAPSPRLEPTTTAGADELVGAGRQALVQGLPDRAEGYFLAATRADPHSVAAWHGLGTSRELRADRTGALDAYRRALELGPSHPDAPAIRARTDHLSPPPPAKRSPRRRARRR